MTGIFKLFAMSECARYWRICQQLCLKKQVASILATYWALNVSLIQIEALATQFVPSCVLILLLSKDVQWSLPSDYVFTTFNFLAVSLSSKFTMLFQTNLLLGLGNSAKDFFLSNQHSGHQGDLE